MLDPHHMASEPSNKAPQDPQGTGPTATAISSIRTLDIQGKLLFLRLDLNVPLSEPDAEGVRTIEDDSRIVEALPTIRYAIEKGAKVILASHLGRPEGKPNPEFSLEPVALQIAKLLDQDVTLADNSVGEGIELLARGLKPGQVLLLENLRFHPGEEANDPEFARRLARIAEVFVTDAFGTAHRKHASTYGLPSIVPARGMGFLIEKELKFLDQLLLKPPKPFYAILGGSKVTDKIKTMESLMRNVDGMLIGGAMAHAFWEAKGIPIPAGARKPKPADVEAARAILRTAEKKELPILIPDDTNEGFDIGPRTIQKFTDFISKAKAIFWNGPLGWFEKPEYAIGTHEIARVVGQLNAMKVVGGGDTVSAVKHAGLAEQFTHLSTGGGAVLEYLEGEGLPGIDILKTYPKKPVPQTQH